MIWAFASSQACCIFGYDTEASHLSEAQEGVRHMRFSNQRQAEVFSTKGHLVFRLLQLTVRSSCLGQIISVGCHRIPLV